MTVPVPTGQPGAPEGQPPGAPATPPAPPATPPVPGASDQVSNPEAQKYAKEAADARAQIKTLEVELKKHQDAQLTDQQKRDRDFQDLTTKSLENEMKLQRLNLENAGYRLGAQLGIGDIALALAIVQTEHAHEVQYEADGTPKNLEGLLKQVLKDHPVLAVAAGQQQRPPASSGGATNPGAGARSGVITKASYAAMSQQERIARNKEVTEALRQNGGRLPD